MLTGMSEHLQRNEPAHVAQHLVLAGVDSVSLLLRSVVHPDDNVLLWCPIGAQGDRSPRRVVPVMKSILAAQSGKASWVGVRAPLQPFDAAEGQRIAQAFKEIGIAVAA